MTINGLGAGLPAGIFNSGNLPQGTPVEPGGAVFNGDRHEKKIALTFDDGPNGEYTDAILEALKDHVVIGEHGEEYRVDVPATFFVLGEQIGNGDQLRRIQADGHEIASHTWDHKDMRNLSDAQIREELTSTSEAIANATGEYPTLFRAPYGSRNARVDDIAANPGMRNGQAIPGMRDIVWDIDTEDWKRPGVDAIVNAGDQAREGSIVLMHDGGGNRSQTVAAVRQLVDRLIGQGYHLVTVPELMSSREGINS